MFRKLLGKKLNVIHESESALIRANSVVSL